MPKGSTGTNTGIIINTRKQEKEKKGLATAKNVSSQG